MIENINKKYKRIELFLEDNDFESAYKYCEKLLDEDPELARVYYYKLMIDLKVCSSSDFEKVEELFDANPNYIKALRFGDESLKNELKTYLETIRNRNVNSEKERIYNKAIALMECHNYSEAISLFKQINDYKDSSTKIYDCSELETELDNKNTYKRLVNDFKSAKTLNDYAILITGFKTIIDYKDSQNYIKMCNENIDLKMKHDSKRTLLVKRVLAPICSILIIVLVIFCIWQFSPQNFEIITYGSYCQNKDEDSKQPLNWLVLEKNGETMTLICQDSIDTDHYNNIDAEVDWSSSSIRRWLNNDFINVAFDEQEKNRLNKVSVTADENPKSSVRQGPDTYDYVYLLSIEEAEKYFKGEKDRICQPTSYSMNDKLWIDDNGFCRWWLRSNGWKTHDASFVKENGEIDYMGANANHQASWDYYFGIRPVIQINIS